MRYLLDTNILIAAMKGVERVREKLEATPLSELVLSPVVLGELELGVEKSQHREKNAARLARIVDSLQLTPLDAEASRHYGAIRAQLERLGTPIGANDYWIAAQARESFNSARVARGLAPTAIWRCWRVFVITSTI